MAVRSTELSGALQVDDFIANEIPSGAIDNNNTDYTLAHNPVEGTVSVYLSGLLQMPGTGADYTLSGKVIIFNKPPRNRMEVVVSYANADNLL